MMMKSQVEVKIECNATLNRHRITPADFRKQLKNRGLNDVLISVILTNPAAITQYFRKYSLNRSKPTHD